MQLCDVINRHVLLQVRGMGHRSPIGMLADQGAERGKVAVFGGKIAVARGDLVGHGVVSLSDRGQSA